jgi:hypothetical protein
MKDDGEHSMKTRVEYGPGASAFGNRKVVLRGFVMELHDIFLF